MEQNWLEFQNIFRNILKNENVSDKLLSKNFLKAKQALLASGKKVDMTFGHCYVLSESAYHILGGKEAGWKPMFIKHLGCPHWFLKHESGIILDLSAHQFEVLPEYERGRGKGFMTKKPCKRSLKVMIHVRYQMSIFNSLEAPPVVDNKTVSVTLAQFQRFMVRL